MEILDLHLDHYHQFWGFTLLRLFAWPLGPLQVFRLIIGGVLIKQLGWHNTNNLYRYRHVPTFGNGTIWRFHENASAMKKLAARDFEDLLQVFFLRAIDLLSALIISSVLYWFLKIFYQSPIMRSCWTCCSSSVHGMHLQNCVFTRCQPSRLWNQSQRPWNNNFVTGWRKHVPPLTHGSFRKKRVLGIAVRLLQPVNQIKVKEQRSLQIEDEGVDSRGRPARGSGGRGRGSTSTKSTGHGDVSPTEQDGEYARLHNKLTWTS